MTPITREASSADVPAPLGGDDAFISYSRRDTDFVGRFRDALERRGKDVWLDADAIPAASDWRDRVGRGIDGARAFVYVLSPDAAVSEECAKEVDHALATGKRIVPVVCRDVEPGVVRPEIAALNWIFLRNGEFDRGLDEVVEALETDLEWLDAHRRLQVRAAEWERGRRDRSFLLSGKDLQAAETWLAAQGAHREAATPLQTAYILASRAVATRRQRLTLTGVLVALAVSIGLGVIAFVQRSEAIRQRNVAAERARVAQSRELAASANAQLAADPELSVLLAAEAARIAPSTQAITALRLALPRTRLRAKLTAEGPAEFSADGRLVVTAGSDGAVRVWDWRSGAVLRRLRVRAPITPPEETGPLELPAPFAASFDPTGRLVATVAEGGVRVWDWRRGEILAAYRNGVAEGVSFSPDGALLAITFTSLDDRIVLWRWRDGSTVRELAPGVETVLGASFSPDGRHLVASSFYGAALVWDWRRDGVVARLGRDIAGPADSEFLTGAAFSRDPEGRFVVTRSSKGLARIWDWRRERLLAVVRGGRGELAAADVGPDGRLLLTAGDDGLARVWEWRSGRSVQVFRGHRGSILGGEFSADGSHVLTVGADRSVRIWPAPSGAAQSGGAFRSPGGPLLDAQLSADAQFVVTSSHDRVARVWDRRSVRELAALAAATGPTGDVPPHLAASFSLDARRIVTAADNQARVWDWRARKRVAALVHPNHVYTAVFTPDGRLVVTACTDRIVRIWDWTRRTVVHELRLPGKSRYEGRAIMLVTVSDDGRHVAGTDFDRVHVWELPSGERLATLEAENRIDALSFGPAGRLLATAMPDGTAAVWDWRSERVLAELRPPGGAIRAVSISPDGGLVATGSLAGAPRMWAWAAEEPVAELPAGSGATASVAFSRDGRFVLSASDEGSVRIRPCDACGSLRRLLALADARVTRQLSDAEREKYLHES